MAATVRSLLLTLIVGVVLGAPLAAQDTVFLRGFEVTPRHIVFGNIDAVRGDSAVVNLGYAHGMQTGVVLVVMRFVQDQLIPIGGLTVLTTEADHSRARVEGPFRVQAGDFVLVHARRLKLFGGQLRLDQLGEERLVRRRAGNGYNTIDASPAIIDEVARDDDFQHRQHISYERPKFVGQAAEKAGVLKSRIGATTPLPAVDPTRPEIREAALRESDSTVLELRKFLEDAKHPNLLIARLATDRLLALRLQTGGGQIDEQHAPLIRQVLLTWTDRALAIP